MTCETKREMEIHAQHLKVTDMLQDNLKDSERMVKYIRKENKQLLLETERRVIMRDNRILDLVNQCKSHQTEIHNLILTITDSRAQVSELQCKNWDLEATLAQTKRNAVNDM